MRVREEGFTFLELIVVFVIIGVLVSAGLVSIRRSPRSFRVRTACRSLINVMNYARLRAVEDRIPYVVRFDIEGGSYSLMAQREADDPGEEDWGRKPLARGSLPTGVFIKDISTERMGKRRMGVESVAFYPDGAAELAILHVGEKGGYFHTLITSPVTGEVRDIEGEVAARVVMGELRRAGRR